MRENLSEEEKSRLAKEAMKEPLIAGAFISGITTPSILLLHTLCMNYIGPYKKITEYIFN